MRGKLRKPIALLMVLVMIFSMSISVLADDEAGNPPTDVDEEIIEVVKGEPGGGDAIEEGQDDGEGEDPGEDPGEGAPEGIEEDEEEEDADLEEEGFEEEEALGDNPDGLDGPKEISSPKLFYPKTSFAPLAASFMVMNGEEPGDNNEEAGLELSKVKESTENERQWKITLTVKRDELEYPVTDTDIVLVIDRSGSMKGDRIAAAIEAAKGFVNDIFESGIDGIRIALVSYASDVTTHYQNDPFKDKETDKYNGGSRLETAINGLKATGGTHTQAAIRQARLLLNNSSAENKYIVLLSDGEPTYSYKIKDITTNNNKDYYDKVGNNYYTKRTLPEEVFLSSTAGNGSSMIYQIGTSGSGSRKQYYYYHNGNSAIAEAGYAKDEDLKIYTIGLGVSGSDAADVLEGMSSDGEYYDAENEILEEIYGEIANKIVYQATVTDQMGEYFFIPGITAENYKEKITVDNGSITYNIETKTIIWSFWGPNDEESNTATMTYIVEIMDNAPSGTHKTNKITEILYDGEKIPFNPIPDVGIGRVIYNANGGTGAPVDENMYFVGDSAIVLGKGVMGRKSYNFIGWNTSSDGEGTTYEENGTITMEDKDIILYAQWEEEEDLLKYNVIYDGGDGGTGEMVDPDSPYAVGTEVKVLPNTFIKDGYRFINWLRADYIPGDMEVYVAIEPVYYAAGDTFEMPENDVTLIAQWEINKYIVTFKDYDGKVLKEQTVEHGGDATAPANPSRSDYNFNGWDKSYKNVTSNLIVTAQYTKKSTGGGGSSSGGTSKPKDKDPVVVVVPVEEIPADLPQLNKADHIQYIQGYPDGTVKPEGHITRDEVAAVFFRLLDPVYREKIRTESHNFSDVASTRWSNKHIATLAKGGIITGYLDGTFKPGNYITRSELATIASRFDNLSTTADDKFSDIAGHWANKYINSAAEKGWVKGYMDGTFKPDQYITRAEFVTLVNNVLERRVTRGEILSESKKFPDLPEDKWYYEAMMEAVNSHRYERLDNGYEHWTEIYKPIIEM